MDSRAIGRLKAAGGYSGQQETSTARRGTGHVRVRTLTVMRDNGTSSRTRQPMRIDHARIAHHLIRFGIRAGDPERIPLLILNGLGANIELAEPFIDALV